ncbi:DUF5819 family protein [Streptomyces sp. NPDC052682]|uniref:DUF5819 family protein n=1 Tax=Streptomyces sp. NPDC052682 TaxID=3154954 RepID=UPI0034284BBC
MDAYDNGSHARRGPAEPQSPAAPGRPLPGTEPATADQPHESRQSPSRPGPPHEPSQSGPEEPRERSQSRPGEPHDNPTPYALAPPPEPRTGVAALSLPYRIGVALALAAVAVGVCAHLGMTFLHVAPPNTLTKQHGRTIDEWIYPEFEQNWKLFAPNPLQQNISVQVRAEIRTAGGEARTTGWYDLSAQDGRAIDGNLLPSHTQQNELRRAWDFFVATHDGSNRPTGMRGALAEAYLRRIGVLRLDRDDAAGPGGRLERVQFRSRTTNVPPPEWSREQVATTPVYRELPWWPVPEAEAEGGVR